MKIELEIEILVDVFLAYPNADGKSFDGEVRRIEGELEAQFPMFETAMLAAAKVGRGVPLFFKFLETMKLKNPEIELPGGFGAVRFDPIGSKQSDQQYMAGQCRVVRCDALLDEAMRAGDIAGVAMCHSLLRGSCPIVCRMLSGTQYGAFEEGSNLYDGDGNILEAGNSPENIEYRRQALDRWRSVQAKMEASGLDPVPENVAERFRPRIVH